MLRQWMQRLLAGASRQVGYIRLPWQSNKILAWRSAISPQGTKQLRKGTHARRLACCTCILRKEANMHE